MRHSEHPLASFLPTRSEYTTTASIKADENQPTITMNFHAMDQVNWDSEENILSSNNSLGSFSLMSCSPL